MNYEEEWDDDESREEENPDYITEEDFVESPDEDRVSNSSFKENEGTHEIDEGVDLRILAQEVEYAAIHEAGHLVVAVHLGLDGYLELRNEVDEFGHDHNDFTLVGGKTHIYSQATPYLMSACGWGGVLADIALDQNPADYRTLANEAISQYLAAPRFMSPTDWGLIFGHRHCWRTCYIAAEIVFNCIDAIMGIRDQALKSMIENGDMHFLVHADAIKNNAVQ